MMNQKNIRPIILDIDGVVLDYVGPVDRRMRSIYCLKPSEHHGQCYDMSKWYIVPDDFEGPKCDLNNFLVYFDDFNKSPESGMIPAFDEMITAINQFYNATRHPFVFITKYGSTGGHWLRRYNNLISHIPPEAIHSLHCIGMTDSKEPYLRDFVGTGAIFIEDSISNAKIGVNLGIDTYLIENSYTLSEGKGLGIPFLPMNHKEIFNVFASQLEIPRKAA